MIVALMALNSLLCWGWHKFIEFSNFSFLYAVLTQFNDATFFPLNVTLWKLVEKGYFLFLCFFVHQFWIFISFTIRASLLTWYLITASNLIAAITLKKFLSAFENQQIMLYLLSCSCSKQQKEGRIRHFDQTQRVFK